MNRNSEKSNKKRGEKEEKDEDMRFLVEKLGTKRANLVYYLRKLFEKDLSARAIVFSGVLLIK